VKYKLLAFFTIISFQLFSQNKNQSIGFIENKGQIINQKGKPNPEVKYLLNSKGLNVQLRKNGFSYDVYEIKQHPLNEKQKEKHFPTSLPNNPKDKLPEYISEYIYHRIDIDFVNSNPDVELIKEGESTDYDNYYNVIGKPEGVTNVHKFKEVTYKNIYANIDVVFSIPKDSLKTVEYNFVVRPGGKIADIQLKFKGVKTDLADNKIKMKVRFGEMDETLPMSWTENGKEKTEIAIGYRKIKKNVYGFESVNSISDKTLIIDPVPVRLWGTYYGGEGNEFAGSINIDSYNNVLISGSTGSLNNISTNGPNTSSYYFGGAFIAKFLPDGQRIWSSYYPFPTSKLKLDSQNNMYLYGQILYDNPTIPSLGCHQPIKDIYTSGYLIKLNSNGAKLWGTYYGGNDNEDLNSLNIDKNGNIYLVGATSSNNAFASPGAFQTTKSSPGTFQTGFIAKFDTNGNRIWGTFYGGNVSDGFFDCDISSDDYLYVVGTHNSLDNITTPGTYQSTTSQSGGMIIKFDLNGNRIWGTFIADKTYLFKGRLKGNNIVLSGRAFSNGLGTTGTMSENITPLPQGSMLSRNENSFIIKFNIQTQQYIWGTYFFEQIVGLDVDSSDNIFFSGGTNINSGLTTPDAYMPIKNNYFKSYLVKLNPLGQKTWGTYYGGNFGEQLCSVRIDLNNDIYLYGTTYGSTTGIASNGASQTTLGSNPDTYLAKFKDCLSSTLSSSNSPICIGKTLELKASGGTNYAWTGPNGFTSNLQNPTILNANATQSGQYSCSIIGSSGCDATNTVDVVVGDNLAPIPNVAVLPTITGDCNVTVTITPTATDNCSGNIVATTTNTLTYNLPGTYTIVWNYKDASNNTSTQNQTVVVNPNADVITPEINYFLCDGAIDDKEFFDLTSKQVTIINDPNYIFSYFRTQNEALLQTNSISNSTHFENETNPQTLFVRVLNTVNNCSSLSKITLTVNPKPIVNNGILSKCDIFLNGIQSFNLDDAKVQINASPNLTFQYFNSLQDLNNGLAITNPNSFSNTNNNQMVYVKVTDTNGCFTIAQLTLTVQLIEQKTLADFILCDDDYDGKLIFDLLDKKNEILTIMPTGNYTFSYYHNLQDAALGNSNTIAQLYSNNQNNEIIYINVVGTTGCPTIFNVKLKVLEKPVLNIKENWTICENVPTTITAGSGFDSYLWSTNATTKSITVSQAGNYSVTVTKNYGANTCSTTKNLTIVTSNKATIATVETQDWTDTENIIAIYATGDGNYEYSLDGINYQDSNNFSGLASGSYTVYVRDKNGCGITKNDVYLLMYPRFFTPNGDGTNDYWNIKYSINEPSLKIEIFDRYGKIIKVLSKNSLGWDGTYDGQKLPATDYWFVVTRSNGKEYRGHFSLKR
jgi:gliding motility-associated-like protein